MRDERFEVRVYLRPGEGYIGSAPELRQPVVALSLGGLRRPRCEPARRAGRRGRQGTGAGGLNLLLSLRCGVPVARASARHQPFRQFRCRLISN
jgi:hypothetical protein